MVCIRDKEAFSPFASGSVSLSVYLLYSLKKEKRKMKREGSSSGKNPAFNRLFFCLRLQKIGVAQCLSTRPDTQHYVLQNTSIREGIKDLYDLLFVIKSTEHSANRTLQLRTKTKDGPMDGPTDRPSYRGAL